MAARDELEAGRLEAVRRYEILDTPADGAFDRVTRLAAKLFRVPIAIVSVVDEDRIWFASHHGIPVEEIGRDAGLCASAILQYDPWLVEDAKIDPRTLTNPLVAGEMGLRFYAGVPLTTSDGYNLGTLCVIDKKPRTLADEEIRLLEDLAGIVMDELELRLAARRRIKLEADLREQALRRKEQAEKIAETLQKSLLPPDLPDIPGLEMAAEYQAAAEGIEVGGDFYDAFATGPGDWAIVIGDVCGKGAEAATITALVRHTIRATAIKRKKPVAVLSRLNEVLLNRDDPLKFCAACYCRVRPTPEALQLRVALAGHPSPLLIRNGGGIDELGGEGMILGVFPDAHIGHQQVNLAPGDICVFYTDGVIEARGSDGEFGLDGLRRLLEECRDLCPAEIAKKIVKDTMEYQNNIAHDDMAVLVLRAVGRPSLPRERA